MPCNEILGREMGPSESTVLSSRPLPVGRLQFVVALTATLTLLCAALGAFHVGGTKAMCVSAAIALIVVAANALLLFTLGLAPVRRDFANEQLKIAALLNSVPEGILEVDSSGVIVFANHQACGLFGYTVEELLQKPIEVLVPVSARAGHATRRTKFFQESRLRAMNSGLNISGLRKDGSEVAVDISLSKLVTPAGPVMYW